MVLVADTVEAKSRAYQEMEVLWELPDDLLGGELRMQAQAARWLPRREAEDPGDYLVRVGQSELFTAYEQTLEDLTSKPFEQPVAVRQADSLSEFLADIEDDVDGEGTNLSSFAKELYREALHRGLTHVLVDMPRVPPDATLEDRRRTNARPVFVHVEAPRLLGWQTERVGNSRVLTQVRIYEETDEPDGTYGEKIIRRVRIYTRDGFEVWRAEDEVHNLDTTSAGPETNPGPEDAIDTGGFDLEDSGTHTFGAVPLVTLYFKKSGFLQGRPVFENVARLNLAHFRSNSRQRDYLNFARVGTIGLLGFTEDEAKAGISWTHHRFIHHKNAQSKIAPVTFPTEPLNAGVVDLERLEKAMQAFGKAPLIERSGRMTATGEKRDDDEGMSRAQAWVRDTERFLLRCYELAGEWMGEELPEGFGVDIFSDFGITEGTADDREWLGFLRQENLLSDLSTLQEVKRRGRLSDALDPEKELEAVEAEGPAPGEDGPGGEGALTTGPPSNGGTHTHTYSEGDAATSADGEPGAGPHTHPVLPDGSIGPAAGHTHPPGSPTQSGDRQDE